MGGKSGSKAASREAQRARQDEQQRQDDIRQGTQRINTIFDGSKVGSGVIGAGTAYSPTGTYYNADGSVWTPTATSGRGASTAANQFANLVSQGKLFSSLVPNPSAVNGAFSGFNDAFFNKRKQAFLDYANPQLEDQYGDARKELTFALARSGLLDSSVRGQKTGELQQLYDLNKQQIGDQAVASESQARNAVEDARAGLITTLNATGDATGAANAALARSAALSRPEAYSPLTQLFADFTNTLGTQAALERANYYSGGQAGGRYSTGLFAPNTKSVTVH